MLLKEILANLTHTSHKQSTPTDSYIASYDYTPISVTELLENPPKPPEWLVNRIFPKNGISIMGGDGGIGKSWLMLYLAMCVSSGKPFFGEFPVTRGTTLIIDEENALDMTYQRLQKLQKGMSFDKKDLGNISLLDNKGVLVDKDDSYGALQDTIAKYQPNLLIFDSLIRIHRGDENSSRDMDYVFRQLKTLSQQYELAVLCTHHTRKMNQFNNSPSQLLRGSSDIRNFVDSYLYVGKRKGETTVVHDKSRGCMPVPSFGFTINDTADGQATVLTYADETAATATTVVKQRSEDKARQRILQLLEDNGKLSRGQIIRGITKSIPLGINAIDKALQQLIEEGKVKTQGGNGTIKEYWLK
jgi:hypothetical protein